MNAPEKQRDTKQRRMVCDAVMRHYDHPDADAIYLELHELDPRLSKATVYRNLNLLAENGAIRHVKVPGAPDRFDRTCAAHSHILCTVCGAVVDSPVPYSTEDDARAAAETGFRITGHETVYEGICPDCLAGMTGSAEVSALGVHCK